MSEADDVGTWDTLQGFDTHTSVTVHPLVFEALAKPSADFHAAVPALAERITHNKDYTEWTATLRPNARFSNGTPVTSADVAFTFRRMAANPQWRYLVESIKRVVQVDRRTVRFVLGYPDTELEMLGFATSQAGIVPRNLDGLSEAEFSRAPIGAGPFEVSSWEPGQEIRLRRNPYYWNPKLPLLEEVDIQVGADDNARLLALQAGQVQVADRLAQGAQTRAGGDTIVRGVRPSAVTDILFLDPAHSPLLSDTDVRRAIWYAIDRRTLAKGVYREGAQAATGVIPPGTYGDAPGTIRPVYDLRRARALMAKSGFPEGGKIVITRIVGDQVRGLAAEAIADQLSKIGIHATVRDMSFAEFSEIANRPDADLEAVMLGYEAVVIPASDILGYFVATRGFNGGYPVGPTARVYGALQRTAREAKAKRLISRWQDYFARNAFAVPTVQPYWIVGQSPKVHGLRVEPTGALTLATTWLEG